jgi:nucleotide-binding universal stress UspA family protein
VERVAHGAPLLVLGSRRHSAARRLLRGSIAGHLAARCPCPVVVVRRPEQPVPPVPMVVAGIAPDARCVGALTYAFQAAWQRRIPLALISVVPDYSALDALAGVWPSYEKSDGIHCIRDATTRHTLMACREQFPGVEVRIAGPVGDAATLLLTESAGAALLVLGSAGGRRGARHLTSVGQRLLATAGCPVAVVGRTRAETRALGSHNHGVPEVHPAGP